MAERYRHRPICQDCSRKGTDIVTSSPVPPGTPIVHGMCPTPINGKPNTVPHRVKWETYKLD